PCVQHGPHPAGFACAVWPVNLIVRRQRWHLYFAKTSEPGIVALTRELNEQTCRFGKSAELSRSPAMRDLERTVCGCDYGSTSGTTRREAEQFAQLLDLRPGVKLLDAGAGSGWPGLYLAQLTGCDVILVDIPLAALRIARERAVADGLGRRCDAVVADAVALPFKEGSFDALTHFDLL